MYSVYTAFIDNMKHLGEKEYADVQVEYERRKEISCRSRYLPTFVGVIPWIYHHVLFQHNVRSPNVIEMQLERHCLPMTEYVLESTGAQAALMKETPQWGLDVAKVTLAPAVYLMLNEQKAIFSTEVPNYPWARILMAIKFLKMEYNHGIRLPKE